MGGCTAMTSQLLAAADGSDRPRFRIQVKHAIAIGPGKAQLLALIDECGSIAQAARRLDMSYQRAWTLVHAMNQHFVGPLVTKHRGGGQARGAQLTPLGREVLQLYRQIESEAARAITPYLSRLEGLIRTDVVPQTRQATRIERGGG